MPKPTASSNNNFAASNASNDGSLWQDLFGSKGGLLFLSGVLFLTLVNIVVFAGINVRPNALLFYLDIRYWSVYFSLFLWITTIWIFLEAVDFLEDYLPLVRISVTTCALLVAIYAMRSFFSIPGSDPQEYSLWLDVLIVVVFWCAVRSLWLFYDYRYKGEESVDRKEAAWFWGMSGFLFAVLIILGISHMIHFKVQAHPGVDTLFTSVSLFQSCQNALSVLIRHGYGSLAIKGFALLLFVASMAFVYVAGKWALIFLSKMKEERGE